MNVMRFFDLLVKLPTYLAKLVYKIIFCYILYKFKYQIVMITRVNK